MPHRRAAIFVCLLGGCGCPANACKTDEDLATSTSVARQDLSNAAITFCLNSFCESGMFANISAEPNPSSPVRIELDGGCVGVGLGYVTYETDIYFALLPNAGCPAMADLSEGDVVYVRLVDANGNIVIDKTHTLELQNGSSCGGTCNKLELVF